MKKSELKKIIKEEVINTLNEIADFPSEEKLSQMKDSLEDLVDISNNAEEAVENYLKNNPEDKKYKDQLDQLAEPMYP